MLSEYIEESMKVADVRDPYTVVINRGSRDGVTVGQRVLIYAIGEEILDPDTKESLGRLELIRGTGKVTHLQERMATVASDMKVAPGRTIRKITGPATRSESIMELMRGLAGGTTIEETLPPSPSPFDSVTIGDLVRKI